MVNNWTARISRIEKVGTRISCEMSTVDISGAETEEEVKEWLADEYEGWAVDQVRSTPEQPE